MERFRLAASSVFFVGYLAMQIGYPSVAWFSPDVNRFVWSMYSGRSSRPTFVVVFEDGSRREVIRALDEDSPARVMTSSVNLRRFLPPHVCSRWKGVREIRIRSSRTNLEEIVPCRSPER